MSRRPFLSLTLLAYLVVGLVAFAPVLTAGFMGDDWFFVDAVAKADSAMVSFMSWNGRFTRPLVTLTYYLSYRHFGLWPVPAHLAVVLLHVVSSWLVCVLVLRLAPPPNRLVAAGSGLIFLLFAGHSEAVAWVAGMADVAVVPFLIGALVLFDRALADPRPARWLLLAWTVAACGLAAKETAMILPALAGAYGVATLRASDWRPRLARTAIFVTGALAICGAYWIFRTYRFGSALGAYTGLGTSEGQRIEVARMFMLRAFVPPGRIAVYLWVHYLDLILLAGLAIAVAIVAARDTPSRRGLGFLCSAVLIALAPAFPLSISLSTTLTERYLYTATVFSAALVAWLIVRLLRRPLVAAIVIAAVACVQWRYLARSNRTWIEGDRVFQTVVSGLAGLTRTHGPLTRSTILLLNMPDTIDRPFVDGMATFAALRLTPPGMAAPERHLRIVAMHASAGGSGEVRVEQADRRFTVDLGQDTLVDGWLRDTDEYSVIDRGPHRFTVLLKPASRRALVASWTSGQVRLVAEFEGATEPFGSLDLPAADATCDGDAVRFAGWALDDTPGVEVVVEREDERRPGSWIPLGAAAWRSGTRPDVTSAFPDFPAADRAEWNYWLACGGAGAVPLPARIRLVARDRGGRQADLGTRTVRAAR